MTETEKLVLKHLQDIRADLAIVKDEQLLMTRKIGTLAEAMVSVRAQLHDVHLELGALHTDVRLMVIAVDKHIVRLDAIETHLGLHGQKR